MATVPHNELVVTYYFTFVMQIGRHPWHSSGQSEHPQEYPHLYRFRILRNCFVVVVVVVIVDAMTHHHLILLATLHLLVSLYQR